MNKKYQVFVSSTFRDLVEERQDTIRTILDLGHIPAGMELFPAADIEQLEYIKKVIDECDYYVLIMGGRYGSLDAEGVSYTEREYDYAVGAGKIILAFVHGSPAEIPLGKSDTAPRLQESLGEFRAKVSSGRLVKFWNDRGGLEGLVIKSLAKAFSEFPAVGWIRGDAAASSELLEQSNQLLGENAKLKAELDRLRASQKITIPDIADLDEAFTIRYRTKYYVSGTARYTSRSINLTWRQIFLGLAGKLDTGRTVHAILTGFREAAKEAGCEYEPHDMDETDQVKIKVQFVALKLITTNVSKTDQGVYEFLHLTDLGRKVFFENTVERTKA